MLCLCYTTSQGQNVFFLSSISICIHLASQTVPADGAVVFNENVMGCRVDMVFMRSRFYGISSIKCISLDGNSL